MANLLSCVISEIMVAFFDLVWFVLGVAQQKASSSIPVSVVYCVSWEDEGARGT